MARSKPRPPNSPAQASTARASATALTHNPFAALRDAIHERCDPRARAAARPADDRQDFAKATRVLLREEAEEPGPQIITRVLGLPPDRLQGLGRQLREALGCSAAIEGRALVLFGAVGEAAAQWLERAGAQVVRVKAPVPLSDEGAPGGTVRAQIHPGLHVAIVQKGDQETGLLTEGTVRDILTRSATHPRGIKVRLASGAIGRVRRILD